MTCKEKQGFTLLELVITMTIIGLTGLLTAHFLLPFFNEYHTFSNRVDAKYLCDKLFDSLEREMRFGRNFEVTDNGMLRWYIVEEDGGETLHMARSRFDSDTDPFIPEDIYVVVRYRANSRLDLVTLSMYVYSTDPNDKSNASLFQQEAVIRSLYPAAPAAGNSVK